MRRVIAAAITAALLLFALLTVGCGATELAEAAGDRFSFEYAGTTGGYSPVTAWTMTDAETGRQWVVLSVANGGVVVEPLYQYARVEPSQDWGSEHVRIHDLSGP